MSRCDAVSVGTDGVRLPRRRPGRRSDPDQFTRAEEREWVDKMLERLAARDGRAGAPTPS